MIPRAAADYVLQQKIHLQDIAQTNLLDINQDPLNFGKNSALQANLISLDLFKDLCKVDCAAFEIFPKSI